MIPTSVSIVDNGIECLVKPLPKYHFFRGPEISKSVTKPKQSINAEPDQAALSLIRISILCTLYFYGTFARLKSV